MGGVPTAPLAHTIHSTPSAVPPAVVSVVGAHGAARECGCTPQVEGGRQLAHAALATKWRRGGSLPALVGGVPTAPLAHTIHSTPSEVPLAVVSVVGAHGAARECGCTPQVEGGRRLAHVGRRSGWIDLSRTNRRYGRLLCITHLGTYHPMIKQPSDLRTGVALNLRNVITVTCASRSVAWVGEVVGSISRAQIVDTAGS